jgi:hypothetical protein
VSTAIQTRANRSAETTEPRSVPEWVVALCVGVLVAAIATVPFLLNHTFYYVGDNPESFVPLWRHFGLQLRSGVWPTMEPAGWIGGNYAGEAAYALWNPVLLVDYLLVSTFDDLAAAAALVQIQFLALLGMAAYLLCREYGARRGASVVVAAGIPVTGFTLFYEAAGWPAGLTAFTAVAWFWWAVRRQSRGRMWPVGTLAFGALGMTTGNPYAALGIIIVLFGVGVELLVRREFRRLLGIMLTGVFVGMAAALVFLPLLGTLPVTSRQTTAWVANDMFLVPHPGDIAASSAFTYLPPILNWGGAVVERLPSTYFLWFAAPLLPWLRWRGFRRPERPLTSLFAITAVFAVLTVGPSNLWLFRWPVRLIEYLYLGLGVLLAVVLSRGLATDHVRRRVVATGVIVGVGAYLSFAVRPDISRMHLVAAVAAVVLALAAVAAFLKGRPRAAVAVLVAGTFLVVAYQTSRFPLGTADAAAADRAGPPTSVAQVQRASESYRGTVLQLATEASLDQSSAAQTGELLFGNETLLSGHESVIRYSGIGFEKFYAALCVDYKGQVCPDAFNRAWSEVPGTGHPLVDLLNVRTLVIDRHAFPDQASKTPPAGWSVATQDSLRTVWVRDSPLPYDGGRLSWASDGIDVVRDTGTGHTESVSFHASAAGRLVFARLDWPGYTATLDGAPLTLRNGPAGLVSAQVPAGDHELELRFRSPGLTAGLALFSAAALLGVVQTLVVLVLAWRRRRAERAPTPDEESDAPATGPAEEDLAPAGTRDA